MQPILDVSPSIALVDEKITVKAHKLESYQQVTVYAKLCSERREIFESYGYFIANREGEIDLQNDASFGGTYVGVDGMGLFWSMRPAPGQRDGIRLMVRNVERPMDVTITMFDGHIEPRTDNHLPNAGNTNKENGSESGKSLAVAVVRRTYLAENVERIPVAVGRLRGALFIPKGGAHYQGIIDLPGLIGGVIEFRGALLASHGFACLSLAYFAYQDLPKHLSDVDLEYFLEAVEWLSKHIKVLPGGIGVIGTSFGGQIALLMASYSSCVSAAVCVSGPSVIIDPAITYKGEYFTPIPVNSANLICRDNTVIRKGTYDISENIGNYLGDYFIPVENAKGRIMVICGEDDSCFPAKEMAYALRNKLCSLDVDTKPIILTYYGAGHLIDPPYMPLCRASYNPQVGMHEVWGGSIPEHNAAQCHCWNAIIIFFQDNVKIKLENKL